MSWRRISEDGVGAARGLATDEVLAQRAGSGASPGTLRLYSYRPHAALVGRFQDVECELDLETCRAEGIELGRRPTGGGAILMGPDQLGVALAVRAREGELGLRGRARELMARFSTGLVRGLARLGIEASFRGKNDLAVDGRKIAGLGIWRGPSGGLLFHASLLVDLDVALMARVLRLPFDVVRAGELEVLERRFSTVRGRLGRDVALDDVRDAVEEGFAQAFDVAVEPGELDAAERAAVDALVREKYATPGWIHQRTEVVDSAGGATVATPGGTLDVRVALAGRTIKAVHVRGDFFEDEVALADLEARLRWHSAEPAAVARTVRAWTARHATGTLPAEAMLDGFAAAVADAAPEAYGCFVSPRSGAPAEVRVD